MKRPLIVVAVLLCVGLSSCQCSEKPDIGPVEGEDQQAHLGAPPPAIEAGRPT